MESILHQNAGVHEARTRCGTQEAGIPHQRHVQGSGPAAWPPDGGKPGGWGGHFHKHGTLSKLTQQERQLQIPRKTGCT